MIAARTAARIAARIRTTVRATLCALLGGGALALAGGCGERAEGPGAPPALQAPAASADGALLHGFPASTFHIDSDRFEAADDPATIAAAEATWLLPSDDVFGVVLGASARAYPVSMLAYHHVVNDTVEGIPIAVTF